MSSFCLQKIETDKLEKALADGKITPEKLIDMTSSQRRTLFEEFVGKDNALNVNILVESKLLLKDQKRGLVVAFKKLTGVTPQFRNDIISKISRMERILDPASKQKFLNDLVAKRFKTEISYEESRQITKIHKEANALFDKVDRKSPDYSESRVAFGRKRIQLTNYVDSLKLRNDAGFKAKLKETTAGSAFYNVAAFSKSTLAAFDNSFPGRQGLRLLLDPKYAKEVWYPEFIQSWKTIYKELKSSDPNARPALDEIKARVYSKENALNGKYEAMGLAIGLKHEEAFPTSIVGKLPALGRVFRASESAFTGFAISSRARIADILIKKAESEGINMLDTASARPIGRFINSMTGRGSLGKFESVGDIVNVTFFSARFWISKFDFLTAHRFNKNVSPFVKREAALHLARVVVTTSAVLLIAEQLYPGSVEWNPHSANFGQIKIKATRFDISGGNKSMITLASRMFFPKKINGKWILYTMNSTTGRLVPLNTGKFGGRTSLDVLDSYIAGKSSPIIGAFIDVLRGRNFQRQKPTVTNVGLGLITPIPVQNYLELQANPNSANVLLSVIADGIGISANTY